MGVYYSLSVWRFDLFYLLVYGKTLLFWVIGGYNFIVRWRKNIACFAHGLRLNPIFWAGYSFRVLKNKLFVCSLALALTCSSYKPYASITNLSNYLHLRFLVIGFSDAQNRIVVLRMWLFVTKNGGGLGCEAKNYDGLRFTEYQTPYNRPPKIG